MPEFILNMGSPEDARAFNELPPFVRGYIEAAFFTDTGPDNESEGLGEDSSFADLAQRAIDVAKASCAAFEKLAEPLLALAYVREGYSEEQAGRDFWFTRDGHGCGFWDRDSLRCDVIRDSIGLSVNEYDSSDLPEGAALVGRLGDLLSDKARAFAGTSLYRGDDGKIYLG